MREHRFVADAICFLRQRARIADRRFQSDPRSDASARTAKSQNSLIAALFAASCFAAAPNPASAGSPLLQSGPAFEMRTNAFQPKFNSLNATNSVPIQSNSVRSNNTNSIPLRSFDGAAVRPHFNAGQSFNGAAHSIGMGHKLKGDTTLSPSQQDQGKLGNSKIQTLMNDYNRDVTTEKKILQREQESVQGCIERC